MDILKSERHSEPLRASGRDEYKTLRKIALNLGQPSHLGPAELVGIAGVETSQGGWVGE